MKVKPKPDQFDMQVGKNLYAIRKVRGISQQKLAETMGVSFQQVQKYEKGINRISAMRLYKASEFLGTNLYHFFDGHTDKKTNELNINDFLKMDKQTLDLIRMFKKIEDEKLKRSILDIFKHLINTSQS